MPQTSKFKWESEFLWSIIFPLLMLVMCLSGCVLDIDSELLRMYTLLSELTTGVGTDLPSSWNWIWSKCRFRVLKSVIYTIQSLNFSTFFITIPLSDRRSCITSNELVSWPAAKQEPLSVTNTKQTCPQPEMIFMLGLWRQSLVELWQKSRSLGIRINDNRCIVFAENWPQFSIWIFWKVLDDNVHELYFVGQFFRPWHLLQPFTVWHIFAFNSRHQNVGLVKDLIFSISKCLLRRSPVYLPAPNLQTYPRVLHQ